MNVLILVAIFLLGSCTESPLEMEQEDEIFSDTRSGISPIDEALANLKTTRLGGPLLTYASLRCPPKYVIEFTSTFSIPERSMRYMGMETLNNLHFMSCFIFTRTGMMLTGC